jgi:DNA-binding HxlR family transcriptional regulator
LEILFQLFDARVRRYSDLEREIVGISPKMLTQQLKQLERDGLVERTVYPQVPPRVEYKLTPWGQGLCPVLDSLLRWASQHDPALAASMPDATPQAQSRD